MVNLEEDTKMNAEINKSKIPMANETLLSAGLNSSSRMEVESAAAPKRDRTEGISQKESSTKKVIKIIII